jgi:hypothetical protein
MAGMSKMQEQFSAMPWMAGMPKMQEQFSAMAWMQAELSPVQQF